MTDPRPVSPEAAPPRYETRSLTFGSYRGGENRRMLTHTVEFSGAAYRPLCRVNSDALDMSDPVPGVDEPPTCATCRKRDPRFAEAAPPRATTPEPHPWYGPCDGFGPGRSCSECAKDRFASEAEWVAWLRSERASLAAAPSEEIGGLRDDPELDGTDGTHPAWWRGNDRGVDAACERIAEVLDGASGPFHFGSVNLSEVATRVAELREVGGRAWTVADATYELRRHNTELEDALAAMTKARDMWKAQADELTASIARRSSVDAREAERLRAAAHRWAQAEDAYAAHDSLDLTAVEDRDSWCRVREELHTDRVMARFDALEAARASVRATPPAEPETSNG